MGANIYRALLVIFLIASLADAYSQCNINDRGTNLQVKANQYPYTVFYRNDMNGAFNYELNLNDGLNIYRTDLRELVRNGKGEVAKNEFDVVPLNIYGELFKIAFAPIKDYITEYKDGGQTYYTEYVEVRRHGFVTQLKAKAFVLLIATNLAGSRLANAPMPVTPGMKRLHPILPSTRANYFQDMFTTYLTTSI
jgi:hypothetical protein